MATPLTAGVREHLDRLEAMVARLDAGDLAAGEEAVEACEAALLGLWLVHVRLVRRTGGRRWVDGGSGPGWSPDGD